MQLFVVEEQCCGFVFSSFEKASAFQKERVSDFHWSEVVPFGERHKFLPPQNKDGVHVSDFNWTLAPGEDFPSAEVIKAVEGFNHAREAFIQTL